VIVVSDASPILSLAVIGRLELLRALYTRVVVPHAVHAEILAGNRGRSTLVSATWIEPRLVQDLASLASLRAGLDDGEAEAIALAVELGADLLLMDERRGRAAAARLGLRLVGLLGALVEARQRGLVPLVKPLLDDLIEQAGFRVSSALRSEILQTAGE
jgi:predicted nucleic acid-binding protein